MAVGSAGGARAARRSRLALVSSRQPYVRPVLEVDDGRAISRSCGGAGINRHGEGQTFRQLAVKGLGRDQPTLILTNHQQMTAKQLIERYAKRWGIENQLAEQIRAFHLDSLCSQVPLAVDFDVTLTILADIIYRHFANTLHAAYHHQTPDTTRGQLIDGIGELRFTPGHIEVALRRRTHTPALLDAGYQDREIQVPWWDGRTLSYSFPAR